MIGSRSASNRNSLIFERVAKIAKHFFRFSKLTVGASRAESMRRVGTGVLRRRRQDSRNSANRKGLSTGAANGFGGSDGDYTKVDRN